MAAAGGLSAYFLRELEAYGLRKLEANLDVQAQLAAALLAATVPPGAETPQAIDSEHAETLSAALASVSPQITTRLRVLDAEGIAVADSGDDVGLSYAGRDEVARALAGGYGAATRILEDGRVALYVARPISVDEEIVGVVYASSTTFSIMTLLRDYRATLVLVILAFAATTIALTELLARWLSAPLRDLAAQAQSFAAGDHGARANPSGARETYAVAEAFNLMAENIERSVGELREEQRRTQRFVSDVSHELRTPLTSIRGAAETLARGDVDSADTERFLSTIVRESDRLARLAEDLLILQRIEGATGELPLSRVELDLVVQRALESLDPILCEREILVECAGTARPVLGDADRLQQVVANLLDNASRVSPRGGQVTVTLSAQDGWSEIAVADEGQGIPPAAIPHLFERFFRSEPSRSRATGGAGLGLAIVQAIVSAHGGSVTAQNADGGGAVFRVRLPSLPAEKPSA